MRRVLDVNILEDEAVQGTVVRWSVPAMVAGLLAVAWSLVSSIALDGRLDLPWLATVSVVYLVSLPVHELVHGAFFKLLGPAGTHVRFGFKQWMLYATCPGTLLPRNAFMAVLLAPFVLLTSAFLIAAAASGAWSALLTVALLHASGCSGDLYFAWVIARHPEADTCEDTETGIALWSTADE